MAGIFDSGVGYSFRGCILGAVIVDSDDVNGLGGFITDIFIS